MYKKILAPVDLHAHGYSYQVAYTALEQARLSNAELTLLKISTPIPTSSTDPEKAADFKMTMMAEEREALKAFADSLPSEEISVIQVIVEGRASEAILDWAGNNEIDLIVMASHKGGNQLGIGMLGTVTSKVAARSKCQVLIVKPQVSYD